MSECDHKRIERIGIVRGFAGPVYTPGETEENRAAHGGCQITQWCPACGADRLMLRNGKQEEYSAWRLGALRR